MGVYIKGMDKETAIRLCCKLSDLCEDDFIYVPVPHGRLIDVGTLEEEHIDYATGDVVPIGWSDISYAPTVIEAEEE